MGIFAQEVWIGRAGENQFRSSPEQLKGRGVNMMGMLEDMSKSRTNIMEAAASNPSIHVGKQRI